MYNQVKKSTLRAITFTDTLKLNYASAYYAPPRRTNAAGQSGQTEVPKFRIGCPLRLYALYITVIACSNREVAEQMFYQKIHKKGFFIVFKYYWVKNAVAYYYYYFHTMHTYINYSPTNSFVADPRLQKLFILEHFWACL